MANKEVYSFKTMELTIDDLIQRFDVYWQFLEFCDERFSDLKYCEETWPEYRSGHKDTEIEGVDYHHIHKKYITCYKNKPHILLSRDINIWTLQKDFIEKTSKSFPWIPLESAYFIVWLHNEGFVKHFEQVYGKIIGETLFIDFHDRGRPWFLWWKELCIENKKFLMKEFFRGYKFEPIFSYRLQEYRWMKVNYTSNQLK